MRNALSLEDLSLVVLRPDNQIGLEVSDPLPDRLTAERLQPERLRNGETTSGSVGNKVWAAAPLNDSQGALGVVVLTRSVDRALGPAVGWFLLASLVAILIAAVRGVPAGEAIDEASAERDRRARRASPRVT